MARRELGPAALRVAQAVLAGLPGEDVVVGCSGGADSLALALGAQWAAAKTGVAVEAVTIDHGLRVSACHNLIAMEIAGLRGARLYPGSWSEWCSDPARPVAT